MVGVAVLSPILTACFAAHRPAALRDLPGASGQAARQSVTAALAYAEQAPNLGARYPVTCSCPRSARSTTATSPSPCPCNSTSACVGKPAPCSPRPASDEPVTWEPPPGWITGIPWPGPDPITTSDLHPLIRARLPASAIAARLGTTADHVLLAASRNPAPCLPAGRQEGSRPQNKLQLACGYGIVEPATSPPRYFAPLQHRDFALLWSGQAVSQLGDGVFTVTLALEALRVDRNPTGLSYVLAARLVPALLFTLLGGVSRSTDLGQYLDRRGFTPNPGNPAWLDLGTGQQTVRVLHEPGETTLLYCLAPRSACLYEAVFSPGTPDTVIIAAIEAALKPPRRGPASAGPGRSRASGAHEKEGSDPR